MDLKELIKRIWQDAEARMIVPGIMLLSGAILALTVATGGRMVCDQGLCVQESTTAFGTVRDAVMYPTSELRSFSVQRSAESGRLIVEIAGGYVPLTVPYTANMRDVERIKLEGERFIEEGMQSRFVAIQEVVGKEVWIKPLVILLFILGTAIAGYTICQLRLEGRRFR